MRTFAVTLQVVSSLLIVLGLGIAGGLALTLTTPKFEFSHHPISFLVIGGFALMPVGVAFSFRWFHESFWPAITVAFAGLLATVAAVGCLVYGLDGGIGGLILIYLSLAALLGAGMLMLGGMLSLTAGRIGQKKNPAA